METLLSTARAETGAAVAFVALYRADGSFAITTSMEEDVPWEGRSLASLARSIWLDPDLSVGKVLVSSARVEGGRMKRRQANVASVVLSDSSTSDLEWGLLSIIAHTDRKFTDQQVDRIVALSKNLATYLSARERMIDGLMDAVRDEVVAPPDASASEDAGRDLEEIIIDSAKDQENGTSEAVAAAAVATAANLDADGKEVISTPETRALDDETRSEFDDLAARAGTNGSHDAPVRTIGEDHVDDVHVIANGASSDDEHKETDEELTQEEETSVDEVDALSEPIEGNETSPDEEEAVPEMIDEKEAPAAVAEKPAPAAPVELTIQVGNPEIVTQIGEAMAAIGQASVESVVLIQVKIAYDEMATTVPTEAARALIAQALKDSVRYEDNVARVGENSFVIVARLRPGSPKPDVIEARLVTAAQTATGWITTGPSFRTEHLVVDPDNSDNPKDVLKSLIHG